jgi:hypothetical protein
MSDIFKAKLIGNFRNIKCCFPQLYFRFQYPHFVDEVPFITALFLVREDTNQGLGFIV